MSNQFCSVTIDGTADEIVSSGDDESPFRSAQISSTIGMFVSLGTTHVGCRADTTHRLSPTVSSSTITTISEEWAASETKASTESRKKCFCDERLDAFERRCCLRRFDVANSECIDRGIDLIDVGRVIASSSRKRTPTPLQKLQRASRYPVEFWRSTPNKFTASPRKISPPAINFHASVTA